MNKQQFIVLGLVLSVAINLLLVGGMGYRMLTMPDPRVRPLPPGAGWVIRDLGEARRSELRPLIEASESETSVVREQMFNAQRRINELIVAEDLDVTALSSAFAELRDASLRYQALSHQQTTSVLAELSAAEREQALEFIRRRGPRGPERSRDTRGGQTLPGPDDAPQF